MSKKVNMVVRFKLPEQFHSWHEYLKRIFRFEDDSAVSTAIKGLVGELGKAWDLWHVNHISTKQYGKIRASILYRVTVELEGFLSISKTNFHD